MKHESSRATSQATLAPNPLARLREHGQSVWLDYIQKSLMDSGELSRLIERDGLAGMTSNPAIFEKAIAGSGDYAALMESERARCAADPKGVYEKLAVADIQRAADILRPVYDSTRARDGYVSLEVSPLLARDTQGTLAEARRLWKSVGRPNLMIKVPGSPEGVPAIRQLVSEGINVNVTLLFSLEAYKQVGLAYMEGLEQRVQRAEDLSRIGSVASFFVSRIDAAVDARLDELAQSATGPEREQIQALRGRTAIANARQAYAVYQELIASTRWKALACLGARSQRLLWASTGTKDARYRDVLYVEELIGPDTVNTIPPATYDAFREHGKPRNSLTEGVEAARAQLAQLSAAGIVLDDVTDKLLADGIKLFEDAFVKLLAAVAAKGVPMSQAADTRMTYMLPADLAQAVEAVLADWRAGGNMQRLWAKDARLWTGADEGKWLGWLDIVEQEQAALPRLLKLAADVRSTGFSHVVLLGMGGSSMCPEVVRKTFGRLPGAPEFMVLDSTDPAQVQAVERAIDLKQTLFIVASKSGSTLEPNIFKQHFYERVKQAVGADKAGAQFMAITDPGSNMQKVAEADRFKWICHGLPSIGGRYSALSDFGLVPAALQGIDLARFLGRAKEMADQCAAATPVERNPGLVLGSILGAAARAGRDKLTLFTTPGLRALGAWLEQLLAESTGKRGLAVIPVDLEAPAAPSAYGKDRIFAALLLQGERDPALESSLAALESAGHPVLRIVLRDVYDLAAELFRWEMATAVAGSVLGINPFDQPDVEAAKLETRKLTNAYEQSGALPDETPVLEASGVRLYTDARNARALAQASGGKRELSAWLRAHFERIGSGDYFGLLAYVEMNARHTALLQELRHLVRDSKRVATCLGFGPRFLHSTGQAYKGGPDSGVFLQITCDDARDLPVPGAKYTFGVVKAAQARGDFAVLAERGRRALRVHLGSDVEGGLRTLLAAAREALPRASGASAAAASAMVAAGSKESKTMKLAMLGLGRMGGNMARRLLRGGHQVVAWNRSPEPARALATEGAEAAFSLAEVIAKLPAPRVCWLMVPAGEPTEQLVRELGEKLQPGDIVIDGGNSFYKDDIRRAGELAKKGIRYLDVGTSGGVWGIERGYCLMSGGDKSAFDHMAPILRALAPGRGGIAPSPGREGRASSADEGFLYCGPAGAGHFVKMVHNGIEYGLMQAYAEGLDILKGAAKPELPAEQRYQLDLAEITELWRRGSVVGSWLLDLTASALAEDPELSGYTGFVQDSGEGRWTIQAAIEESVPADVLTAALYVRFRSRQEHTFAEKTLSAMRAKFGGHQEKRA